MRLAALLLAILLCPSDICAQKQLARLHRNLILNAKTVCFLNTTGSDSVEDAAFAELKKWGRYILVPDSAHADLVFLLSGDPYRGGNILFADGQTGITTESGITKDRVPNYTKASPTREAYLAVIDPKTGENLWSDHHVWGGLLTGFNSVGARLIRNLENQLKH